MQATRTPPTCTSAGEVAKTWVLGGIALAATNALAIAFVQPWPAGGALIRVQHHLFDALHVLGLASVGALIAAGFSHGPRRLRALGWIAYAVITCALVWPLLGQTMTRQAIIVASKLGFEVPGPVLRPLRIMLLLLVGLSVPATHWVAELFFRFRYGRAVLALASLAAIVVGHSIMRDEYEDIHTAILWPAALGMGACLLPLWPTRFESASGRKASLVAAGALAALAILAPPPNQLRFELFRAPGAVASFALAQTVWPMPTLPGADRSVAFAEPSPVPVEPTLRTDPVVVIFGVDAMRGDVIRNGEHDDQLRHISRLRDEGAYFARALAPGSQTSVTYTSMFSGRYFSQLDWGYYGEGRARRIYAAKDPTPRLAELLSASGVRTVSFLSPGFLAGDFGVARGFREEREIAFGHAHVRDLMKPLLQALRRHGKGPGLFFTHLMDPHEPYDRGKLATGAAKDRYLSELTLVDASVGALRALMKQRFSDRGYIVLLADHGEAFGEHHTTFHSKTLYQELIHVPLIFWGPGIVAERHEEWVSLMDVAPTLLALFGMAVPSELMGESLRPSLEGNPQPARTLPVAAEGRLKRALVLPNGVKAIEDRRHKTIEVYDLDRDPEELDNLVGSDPRRAADALATLRALFGQHARENGRGRPVYKR